MLSGCSYDINGIAHRQFHILPSLLDSQTSPPKSSSNACVPGRKGVVQFL